MRKILLSVFAVLLMCVGVSAQNLRITGTVTDSSGAPMLAVTVAVVGTTNATITDLSGAYEISAPKNATLEFSYVGMATELVAVAGRTKIDVALKEDAQQIEDIVITAGYGSGVASKSLVGSVSSVKGDKIANAPVANVSDVLQGKVPGLQIFTSSGEPTATSTLMMRGVSSINAGSEPLIILDGAPVTSAIFNNINSNDIENVVMLKDAASTSIYGSRAANGVLFVTTKKGRRNQEQSMIQIRMQGGFSSMINNRSFVLMNALEQMTFEEWLYPDLLRNSEWLTKKWYVAQNDFNFDWKSYAYQGKAPLLSTDASISGASGSTNYYVSFGYLDTDGIAPSSRNTRYTFRTNLDTKVKDWLRMGINVGLTYADYETSVQGWYQESVDGMVYGQAPYNAPYEIIYHENGKMSLGEELLQFDFYDDMYNPYHYYENNKGYNNDISLSANSFFEITPKEGLIIKAAQAIDGYDYRHTSLMYPEYAYSGGEGQRTEYFSRYYQMTATNTAEYKFSLNDLHNFTTLLGQESILGKTDKFGVTAKGMTDRRLMMMTAGKSNLTELYTHSMTDWSSNSVFSRVNYNYDEKYYLDASLRADGSSKFGADNRWGVFWSIGGMWNLKQEEFMFALPEVNDMRLKMSYGTTGNSSIDNYLALGLISSGAIYDEQNGTVIGNPANPDLTWEVVKSFNVGVSTRLYNRLNLEVEYYNRVTENMLMSIPYSATTGYSSGWGNVGKMRNRGVDVQFSYDLYQSDRTLWSVYGNVSYNRSKILELYGSTTEYAVGNIGVAHAVGHRFGEFRMVEFAGVDKRDGRPMWYDIDGNITKTYNANDAQWSGKSFIADWNGGFGSSLTWGNLQLNVDFSWVGERWMMVNEKFYTANLASHAAGKTHYERQLLNMWREPGQETNIPKAGTVWVNDSSAFSNAAFLRLKNLSLSYNIPGNRLGLGSFVQGVRVYLIGRNLLTFTNHIGFDPEYLGLTTQGTYPGTRQYTAGLELTF